LFRHVFYLAIALLLFADHAAAVSITATARTSSATVSETPQTAVDTGPAGSAVNSSTNTPGVKGIFGVNDGGATSSIGADGSSQVIANSRYDASSSDRQVLKAETELRQSRTNQTGATQSFELEFALRGMSIMMLDTGPSGNSLNPFDDPLSTESGAFIGYSVAVNGVDVFNFGIEVFGQGSRYGTAEISISGNAETTSPNSAFTPTTSGLLWYIDDVVGTIDLGEFETGESLEVVATMTAMSSLWGDGSGALALMGGPQSPSGTGAIRYSGSDLTIAREFQIPPVPLPATAVLVIGALAGLGFIRSRRKSKSS
jgi:hypothetical protein